MNALSKIFMSGLIATFATTYATGAQAGWLDKISQVNSRVNQTTQSIQQIKQTKQTVDGIANTLPKPSAKKKQADDSGSETSGTFELTKTSNPIKGEWGTQEKACAVNSATCQNGMVDITNCMHQTKGYYFRLIAAHLEGRLGDQDLTADDRTMLEEDIASLNEAVEQETDQVVDPDPEYPSRYMAWLTDEDQHEIQKLNGKYMNEVRDDCDSRFGGMARYSN